MLMGEYAHTIDAKGRVILPVDFRAALGEHFFITNSDGSNTAKSPMDMFEARIDNDLAMVDRTIREYYELGGTNK